MHWGPRNSVFPVKDVRSLNLLDRTLESPPEHPHTSRGTLMSLQGFEIAWCSPNQLKIMPDSPALAPEEIPVPIIHNKWIDFL